MSQATNIPAPPADFSGTQRYNIRPREKRTFHTVLDAQKMLSHAVAQKVKSEVVYSQDGSDVVLAMKHPIADGYLKEEIRLATSAQGLKMRSLLREVFDASGVRTRHEHVSDFRHDDLGLPLPTYPEVALPFLLGWTPFDGERRSVYAWINDRFIAKVYTEVDARSSLAIGGVTHDTVEIIMYPDLNDWVPLGAMLTRLIKPFAPKYRMWYARQPPFRLVRFEGPYGPPGAPEVVLEVAP